MANELTQVIDEVKSDYDELSQQDRYLDALSYENEDNVVQLESSTTLSLESELPPEDDDTLELTPKQVEEVIAPLSVEVIKELKIKANIHGKTTSMSKIANHISQIPITHKRLRDFIEAIERSLSFQTELSA